MALWNIRRVWQVVAGDDDVTHLSTDELSRFRCVVLLGAAGAGKTTEARRLAEHERASGRSVRECRLAEYAGTSAELEGRLQELSAGADAAASFHLDALDEAMIPERRRWLAIKHWIERDLQETGASIRITCRSAVWPPSLSDTIRGFCGQRSFATAYLQPLTDDDVSVAAESLRIAPDPFLKQIENARARNLARHPLTLRMLLSVCKDGGKLPSRLKDLFDKGVRVLARDREDRREIGTEAPLPVARLLDAAERLACYTILSGREAVNLGDERSSNQLDLQDLSGRIGDDAGIDENDILRAVGASGLCDSEAPRTFRFAHRQFAEYLVGRRLARLPTHQARAFLAGPDGRSGAAGPLRETAAFAAMFNPEIAAWLTDSDPEVIGSSDVADSALRRRATLELLDRFRGGSITASEIHRSDMELGGLQYEGAETDLRPVLEEREYRCADVLEYVISLIKSWRLSTMSDALVDLVLDRTAPLRPRERAGRVLWKCGTDVARERLKSLAASLPEDERDNLKGIALQCNWPDRLSPPELFDALTPERRPSFYGNYGMFLHGLDADGFPPAGHVALGLVWARSRASERNDTDPLHRLGMRIAHAALRELDNPEIAVELVGLMRRWMKDWKSPLAPLRSDPLKSPSNDDAPLYGDRQSRRKLIDRIVERIESDEELKNVAFHTPGFLRVEDFQWLLQRSCDDGRVMEARERYLHIAIFLPWEQRTEDVDAWLRVCDIDPVKKVLGNQRSIDLDSAHAIQLRKRWKVVHDRQREVETTKLYPPPSDRVLRILSLSETEDVRCFPKLCQELTLEPTSTRYGFERFLMNTPGWRYADTGTRTRIVDVAKRYLSVEGVTEEFSSKVSPGLIHGGGLKAMWLILARDPDWFKSRDESWWAGWCRYILAEARDPKLQLVALLNEAATASVSVEVMRLSSSHGTDGERGRLSDALRVLEGQPNTDLDEALCEALEAGELPEHHVGDVVDFVLVRASDRSVPVCLRILEDAAGRAEESRAERVAAGLLRKRPSASWSALKTYLDADPSRARRVLKEFARDYESIECFVMSTPQLGELLGMSLDLFQPESDSDEGVASSGPGDVRWFRDRLIDRLDRLCDEESVEVFRRLDQEFGDRYSWLAHERIHVTRRYHRSRWSPFSVDVIADVLNAETRRLLRSGDDVVDGIEHALDQYAGALRQDRKESVEDLWNTAADGAPSPKPEPHVSQKLCGVVKDYFQEYAVTADREIEIRRRSVSRSDGGEPGSEVDVLVQALGRGTVSGDAIRVPIEVKLSSNDEAKTGMQEQLVGRYMPQLDATHGVYVVVWMTTPNPGCLRPGHRPKWDCIETARRELNEQARRLSQEREVRVRAVVVDGSLR